MRPCPKSSGQGIFKTLQKNQPTFFFGWRFIRQQKLAKHTQSCFWGDFGVNQSEETSLMTSWAQEAGKFCTFFFESTLPKPNLLWKMNVGRRSKGLSCLKHLAFFDSNRNFGDLGRFDFLELFKVKEWVCCQQSCDIPKKIQMSGLQKMLVYKETLIGSFVIPILFGFHE